jgi:inner membrane protein COX18
LQAKRREWRIQDIVVPQIEKLKPTLIQSVLREMKSANVSGTKQELQAVHARRVKILV